MTPTSPLTFYNTLTRQKESFAPLDPACVRLYVCGPTVYDRAHIGNARAVIAFDVLYRVLRAVYGTRQVRYVRNITDVDDKINAAARDNGEPIGALTGRTIAAFHADMEALNALAPDIEPRATEHIGPMIAMIARLIGTGHAYAAEGHVLFSIASWPEYGGLSGRSRDEMIAGARVEIAPYKRDPGDFVLWKPSGPDLPGWDSPWGRGRPGWHIECSAMSAAHLGETFDIHGGGLDLIFPHHENEIAQSVCAHGGQPFVRYWMHNGFLTVDGAKMSKSLGNFRTVAELLQEAPGEAIRLALIGTHYRDPLDWTAEKVKQARATLDRFYRALSLPVDEGAAPEPETGFRGVAPAVAAALSDDLNTPLALAAMHDLAGAINRAEDPADRSRMQTQLRAAGAVLGILRQAPLDWLRGEDAGADEAARIEARIAARRLARSERRFADADAIRDALAAEGILLEDGPQGTLWRRRD